MPRAAVFAERGHRRLVLPDIDVVAVVAVPPRHVADAAGGQLAQPVDG